jgi:hypothetical protein
VFTGLVGLVLIAGALISSVRARKRTIQAGGSPVKPSPVATAS